MNEDQLYDKYYNVSQVSLNNSLISACNYGNLDEVKFLLTAPKLKLHADIDNNDGLCLAYACMNNHTDIVEYLLTSKELVKNADIHINEEYALFCSANNDFYDLFKYLLTSPDLKEHADIHAKDDYIFKTLCSEKSIDLIDYLIFDYKINMTEDIQNYLNEKDNDFIKQIKGMFAVRDLSNTLENELSSDIINKKRTKI